MSATGNIFAEFLEDYFAETDEHLAVARQNLLALDVAETQTARSTAIANLLRSFHSLKGLSAMVGVNEITQMSHLIEEYLREAQNSNSKPDAAVLDSIMKAVAAMEEVVQSRRKGVPAPDVSDVLNSLQLTESAERTDILKPVQAVAIEPGVDWCFSFSPSAELAEQGINVNSVRENLGQIGTILTASPRVIEGGIAFDFVVRTELASEQIVKMVPSGVTFRRSEQQVATPAPTGAPEENAPAAASFVRVDMHKLDDLMRLIGEMVISRSHFDETIRSFEKQLPPAAFRSLQEVHSRIERQLRNLRDAVMHVRMVPIGQIFERMRFVVRGLERDTQKRVRLEIEGQDTQIDKLIVDRMSEPLLHLVRNAVSHGIREEGTIGLSARTHGEKVVIEVRDDGSGVDFDKVTRKARKAGLIGEKQTIDASTVLDIICSPGFSTRENADFASGRGVGMAVVRSTIQELGGTLGMGTAPDKGTTFTITLPLTLLILPALLLIVDEYRYAIPQSAVREIIAVDAGNIKHLENNTLIPYRGAVLPVVAISDLLRISGSQPSPSATSSRRHVLVIGSDNRMMGLIVDKVTGQREIVVRTISDPQLRIPGVVGATELGDGRPVMIVDPEALMRLAKQKKGRRS
jgi:two-component system chemotaxis sensor kinase CheA